MRKKKKQPPKKNDQQEVNRPAEELDTQAADAPSVGDADDSSHDLVRKHMRIGWWSLLLFLTLGIFLEALHGFKVGWYLEAASETRRLMFTLAHAHGVLLSLVHLGFAFTLSWKSEWPGRGKRIASAALGASVVLIPGGFFLGGVWIYGGDPGLGILLVPLGALCLFAAVFLTARHAGGAGPGA